MGVDLLDYVPDPVDAAADLPGDVCGLPACGFSGWGDHSSTDVVLVGAPFCGGAVLEQAEGVQDGDIVGRARAGI